MDWLNSKHLTQPKPGLYLGYGKTAIRYYGKDGKRMGKLTVIVPDNVHRRAKARAALEGTNLSEAIRAWLEEYATRLEELEEADDVRLVKEREARLARGEEDWVTWDEVKAELDATSDSAAA